LAAAEDRYAAIVEQLLRQPDVAHNPTESKRFGSSALTTGGHIFAMLVRGRLVVKLPRGRVDELVEGGEGQRFDAGRGRPMKEWLSIDPASEERWLDLVIEALEFGRSKG
jgi:hypothetical protein